MLSKKHRIKGKREFNSTFKEGEFFSNSYLEVRVKERDDEEKKIAFVAPVGRFKKATRRNRVKRIMKEAAGFLNEELVSGINIIFIIKKDPEEISKEERSDIIRDVLSEANILKK